MPFPEPGRPGAPATMVVMERVRTLPFLIGGLLTIEIFLVVMHFVAPRLVPPLDYLEIWFDMDREANIPSWFSSSQLLVVGVILGLLGVFRRDPNRPSPWFLVVLGVMFVFLSMDEAIAFHERISRVAEGQAWAPGFRHGHGVWIFVYGLAGVLMIAVLRHELVAFWRRYPAPARAMLAGLALAAAGAVGLEIGFYYLEDRAAPLLLEIQVAAEEFLEMFGVTVVLVGVVLLCQRMVRLQQIA